MNQDLLFSGILNQSKGKFMSHFLEFEKSIAALEGKIEEMRRLSEDEINITDEIERLQTKIQKQLKQVYTKLSPWQKTMVARHPNRPHFQDYLKAIFTDFIPLAGDRLFGEDQAVIGGVASFMGQSVIVIGQEKGSDTESRIQHNFGMAKPEGYRKAQRLMALAEKFKLPIITFIDTAGAYPGLGAEERGQSEAIAKTIEISLGLTVPIISVVIGEGGSGGAIAIATANKVLMLEHSIYSVISPEGCASILWRSGEYAKDAAEALKLTAQDLNDLDVIDDIIEEPLGGAHRFPETMFTSVRDALQKSLLELESSKVDFKKHREDRFLKIGREI